MATHPLNNSAQATVPPAVPEERLRAIAYYVIGIGTEGGKTPYTGAADAGGASGLSIGVMQHDFGQNPAKAQAFAQAIVKSSRDSGQALNFTAQELEGVLKKNSLSSPMRQAIARFGATDEGADWIHTNLDLPHVNAAIDAAKRALDTPYGKAVVAQGMHVDEFAAFAMKVYNQYGNGVKGGDGKVKSPGFGAFLDYLNNQSVELRDNRHPGKTVTVTAQRPGEFDKEDLLRFARAYTDTRKAANEGVYTGPEKALTGGGAYRAMQDSVPSIADAVKRVEANGIPVPSATKTDPDAALVRAMAAASPAALKTALHNMESGGAPAQLQYTLGQYPGTLFTDPQSGRVAVVRKDGSGFDRGPYGYSTFASSAIKKGALTIAQADGSLVPYAIAPLTQTFSNPPPAQPLNPTPTGARMSDQRQDSNNVTLQTSNGIELRATRASEAGNWLLHQSRADGVMATMGELPKSLTAAQLHDIAQEGVFNSRATAAKDWNMNNDSSFTPASVPLDFAINATTFTNKKGLPVIAAPLQEGKDGVLVQGANGEIISVLRSPANTPPLTPEVLQQYINKEGLLDGVASIPQVGQRPLPPRYETPAQAPQPGQQQPASPGNNPSEGEPQGSSRSYYRPGPSVQPNAGSGNTVAGTDEPLWGGGQTVKTPGGNTVKIALSEDGGKYNISTMDDKLIQSIQAKGNTVEGLSLAIQQGQYGIDGKIQRNEFISPSQGTPGLNSQPTAPILPPPSGGLYAPSGGPNAPGSLW